MKREQILGIVRHSLTFVGGFLVMKGITDDTMVNEIVGATMTVIGGIWSIIDKK